MLSLRSKILSAIILINIGISAFLAIALYQDSNTRHIRAQERTYQNLKNLSRVIYGMFTDLLASLVDKDIAVKEILQWPYWNHVEDVQIVQYYKEAGFKKFVLNPLGAFHRKEGFYEEGVKNAIEQAYVTEKPIEKAAGEPGAVAMPIYLGRGESREKWGGVYFVPRLALEEDETPPPIGHVIGIITAGTFLLMLITYTLVSRIILRPLENLKEATARLSCRDYSAEIPVPKTKDEIHHLIVSFNAMLSELRGYHENLESKVEEARDRVKRTERHLVIAQRLAAMGKLVSGIAHEINNPLGGMLNISRNLSSKKYSEKKTEEYLNLIVGGLTRIQQIVNRVLQFSPRKVKPRKVNLVEVADQAMGLVRHRVQKKVISFEKRLQSEAFWVFGDPFELQQVLMNLLINSVDAIEERGRIIVSGMEEGEEVVMQVIDNGKGMDQADVVYAFDPFYTTKDAGEGTGLGLSIAYSIVEAHGGTLEIRSERGKGTTVTLRLPRIEEK